jgi:hypothetical protein
MRLLAYILFWTLFISVKGQSTFNADSLFQAFTGENDPAAKRPKIGHCLEILPVRFYEIPPYAYTTSSLGAYFLTGGMYKMYFNDQHAVRLGFEMNKESYHYGQSTPTAGNTTAGSKRDQYLRYGYERVIAEGSITQLYLLGDGIYVSSIANTTKDYWSNTYSDPHHSPVQQLTKYDSSIALTTQVRAGLLQLGIGGRLFFGKWYASSEMAWGINIYKKEEEYNANAVFTRVNITQGYNAPSYDKTYDGDNGTLAKIAFSATYLRLGLGYIF